MKCSDQNKLLLNKNLELEGLPIIFLTKSYSLGRTR